MSDLALQKQWSLLATAAGIEDDGLFDDLITRYSEPHRHYHNVEHLAAVVRHIEKLAEAEKIKDRNPLALAGWFHDAIHDIRSSTNEADSAALAEIELARRGASPVLCERVARLVEMTAHDRPPRDDPAAAVLLDADLAILAAPAEVYDAYVEAIRDEYAFVPDDVFRRGRVVVLNSLKEGSIFSSKSMKPLEKAALENIERELKGHTASE